MEDKDLAVMIGRLDGRLEGFCNEIKGIRSEIKEVKSMLTCKSEDCVTCRGGIDQQIESFRTEVSSEISVINEAIDDIKDKHVGETAISRFANSALVKIGIVVGICGGAAGVYSLVKELWP